MSSLFLDLSVDAKELMLGNVIFFENVEISKDDVYNLLILPSNILDESTKQCLEIKLFRKLMHHHKKNVS